MVWSARSRYRSQKAEGEALDRLDAGSTLQGVRVLVVEDDFLILTELKDVLLDAGALVVGPYRTIKDALVSITRDDVAVAILDIRVGRETIAPVACQLSRRGIPFLFYTAQTDMDPIHAEWPRCTIVSKPAQAETIVGAVAATLRG